MATLNRVRGKYKEKREMERERGDDGKRKLQPIGYSE